MRWAAVASVLASVLMAHAQDVPYYIRNGDANQSYGGFNVNFQDQTQRRRDNLVPKLSEPSCSSSEVIYGATIKGGYIFGGTCGAASSVTTSSAAAVSTFTTLSGSITETATSASVCKATVTAVLTGNAPVIVEFNGPLRNSAGSQYARLHVLQDGAFFDGQTGTIGLASSFQSAASTNMRWPGQIYHNVISTPTAGTHSFCLAMSVDGGTGVLDCDQSVCQFGVFEMPSSGPQGPTGPAGGVTSVTGTAPIASSGGTTPVISLNNGGIDTTKMATDAVTTVKIINGAVDTTKLATDAVANANVLNGAIDTLKIASGAVDTNRLKADSVTTFSILNSAVDTRKVAQDAINTTKVLTDSITTVKLINSAVDTTKLATDAVTTAKVINLAIDTTKLATDSVTNAKILNASVDTNKISSGAVDTNRLKNDSVTSAAILNSSVNTNKIATDAVDTGKIARDAVTTSKLINLAVDTTKLATDSVTTAKLINSAVDTTKLATDAVTTAKVINAAIDTTKLATDSVSTAKIVNLAVDTTKLATDSVITAKLINSAVDTKKLAADAVDTTKILNDSVTVTKILASGSEGNALTITAGKVAWGTVSGTGETNTYTSSKTFTSDVNIKGELDFADVANATYNGTTGAIAYKLKNLSGATASTGCVVAIGMGSGTGPFTVNSGDPATGIFTSTTSAAGTEQIGVVLESCTVNSICKVAIFGPVRAQMASGSAGNQVQLSATRCQGQFSGTGNSTLNSGNVLNNVSSNWAWIFLGAR